MINRGGSTNASPKSYKLVADQLWVWVGQFASVAWGQVVVAIIAIASVRAYTELLSPSKYGDAMLALGLITLFDSCATMALNQTVVSFCGRLPLNSALRANRATGIVTRYLKAFVPTATFIAVVACVVLWRISQDAMWFVIPLVTICYITSEGLKNLLQPLLLLEKAYTKVSMWQATEATLTLVAVIVSLKLWRSDSLGFIVGWCLSRPVTAILFLSARRRTFIAADRSMSDTDVREIRKYFVPVASLGPLGWISTYVDRYVLGISLGTAATGTYVAVSGLASRPFSLTTSVLTNLFRPRYFQSDVRPVRVMHAWVAASFAIGLAGTLAFAVLAKPIASLALAEEYRAQAPILLVLIAGSQTFAIMTHACDNAILSFREGAGLLKMQGALSVATVLFIPAGIFIAGIPGAAAGRLAAEVLKFVAVYAYSRRLVSAPGQQNQVFSQSEKV